MSRDVTYSVVARKNPQNIHAAARYYAQTQSNGEVSINEMAVRIEKCCTVTKADTVAVLVALEDVIMEALSAGEIVRLADLGTFQIGVSGAGAVTADKYNVSLIKKARINFRPSKLLRGSLSKLTYSRVPQKYTRQEEVAEV